MGNSPNSGSGCSIVLDRSAIPHVAYYSFQHELNLMYAKRAGSVWQFNVVNSDIQFNGSTSIQLDSHGQPAITYVADSILRLSKLTGNGWTTVIVDSNVSVGFYNSFAIDSNDTYHIVYDFSYFYPGSSKTPLLNYVFGSGQSWIFKYKNIYLQTNNGANALAIDSKNVAHFAYRSGPYVIYWKVDGGTYLVEDSKVLGDAVSIAVDNHDIAHVCYTTYDKGIWLKYAKWTGTGWSTSTIDSGQFTASHIYLKLDKSDNPHVCYYDALKKMVKYAKWTGSSWQIEEINPAGNASSQYAFALDSHAHPHIIYYHNQTNQLQYTRYLPEIEQQMASKNSDTTIEVAPQSGEISVLIEKNTFSRDVLISVKAISPPEASSGIKHTGIAFEVNPNETLTVQQDITIQCHYRDSDVFGMDLNHLKIARYDETGARWILLDSSIKPSEHQVVAITNHLSKFALVEADSSGADIGTFPTTGYPNPFNPDKSVFRIFNLPAQTEVQIYSMAGELIQKLVSDDGKGQATWDGRNESGQTVSSAIYIGRVTSGKEKRLIKIAVLR